MPLIRLEFAYENDTYYCDNLMQLTLDQFLEMDLMKNHGFKTVSFIEKNDAGFICKQRKKSTVKNEQYSTGFKGILGNGFNNLCNHIKETLYDKNNRAALILRLEDFCDLLKKTNLCNTLNSLDQTKITGIIVLKCSPLIEHLRNIFVQDCPLMICDTILKKCVISGERNFFKSLYNMKLSCCRFLNAFSKERIKHLVQHLVLEDPKRCSGQEAFDLTVDFLYCYVNNEQMQHRFKLFSDQYQDVLISHSYHTLYQAIDDAWARIQTTIHDFHTSHEYSLQSYLSSKNYLDIPDNRDKIFIAFDQKSSFSQFLIAYIRSWMPDDEKQAEEDDALAAQLCSLMHCISLHSEPPEILSPFDKLIKLFDKYNSDFETRQRLLKVLKFCMEYIYTDEKETLNNIENTLMTMTRYVELSAKRNQLICTHNNIIYELEKLSPSGQAAIKSAGIQKQQTEKWIEIHNRLLDTYDANINANIFNQELHETTKINSMLQKLNQELQKAEKIFTQEADAIQPESCTNAAEDTSEPMQIQNETAQNALQSGQDAQKNPMAAPDMRAFLNPSFTPLIPDP